MSRLLTTLISHWIVPPAFASCAIVDSLFVAAFSPEHTRECLRNRLAAVYLHDPLVMNPDGTESH